VINKNETEYDAEFIQALQFWFEKWITKFKTIEDFKPYDKVTREQSSKMIGQFATEIFKKIPDESKSCMFADIKSADYSLAPHIIQACKLGIMKGGSDGYFLPTQNLSKAQAIAVIIRLFNNGLLDESTTPWYRGYYEKAKELWLTKESNIEALDRPLTRYELVLLLYRFYVKYDLLNKFGNTFDMGGSAIKMSEESVGADGLKSGRALVDTKKFLDQNTTSVTMNIFGMDYRIEKTKLVNQFVDAFTWYGDVYKGNDYIWVSSFNIVKEILTDGTIRPLNTTDGKYFTIAMSSQPPFYDIKEVIQSTTAQLSWTTTSGTLITTTWLQSNGITTGTNTSFTGSSVLTWTVSSGTIVTGSMSTWSTTQ
jgi:S-layer homology domain